MFEKFIMGFRAIIVAENMKIKAISVSDEPKFSCDNTIVFTDGKKKYRLSLEEIKEN